MTVRVTELSLLTLVMQYLERQAYLLVGMDEIAWRKRKQLVLYYEPQDASQEVKKLRVVFKLPRSS